MFTDVALGPTEIVDRTVLERQNRRIERLKEQGITRSTVLVHDECRTALDSLRPYLVDPEGSAILFSVVERLQEKRSPTNVAQVRQLSPFRYPGGKTWLVPEVRKWINASPGSASLFIEPFAGGAMVGLTAAFEHWSDRVVLAELDEEVAAVWETILSGDSDDVAWLCNEILSFRVTSANVRAVINSSPRSVRRKAFRTIIKNRMQRGGIMAPGAGLLKTGENGRGLESRWYPATLVRRIRELQTLRQRLSFERTDAFDIVKLFSDVPDALFFIDPPYTAGNKRAGRRLYLHNDIDHERLFSMIGKIRGSAMLTYDDDPAVRSLVKRHGFRTHVVPMKNTHHAVMSELLILKP
jgi:DNA adenine methylase